MSGRPAVSITRIGMSRPSATGPWAPSEVDLETARQLVDEYDQAQAQGRGAIRDEQGRTIEEAVVRRARILPGHLRV